MYLFETKDNYFFTDWGFIFASKSSLKDSDFLAYREKSGGIL